MNNEEIIKLLSNVSLAVVTALTKRDNGIGMVNATGTEGFNKIYKIRKAIVDEKILLPLREKSISINHKSFLNAYRANEINYDEVKTTIDDKDVPVVEQIAVVVENELLKVRDELIPMVNQISDEIETAVGLLGTPNLQLTYDLNYNTNRFLLATLTDSERLTGDVVSISSLGFTLPEIDSIEDIIDYATIGNTIIDEQIAKIIDSKSADHWISIYNAVFGNLVGNNANIIRLKDNNIPNINTTMVLYLIARNFNSKRKVPHEIKGSKSDYESSISTIKNYLGSIIGSTNEVMTMFDTSKVLIMYNRDNTIVVNKQVLPEGIDADTIIAAAMDDAVTVADIVSRKDELKNKYIQVNDLLVSSENAKRLAKVRAIIMETLDNRLSEDERYSKDRLSISEMIYDSNIDKLSHTKKVVAKTLLETVFYGGNTRFIFDRMKKIAKSGESTKPDFSAISEHVALELICNYLVNTHIVCHSDE